MAFESGHEKVGGRQKGTANHNTKELRIILRGILEEEIEKLPMYLSEVKDSRVRLELIIKLMPYVFPKMVSETLIDINDYPSVYNQFELDFSGTDEKKREYWNYLLTLRGQRGCLRNYYICLPLKKK